MSRIRVHIGVNGLMAAVALMITFVTVPVPAGGQEIRALTIDQVERLINAQVPVAQILQTANQACLDFRVEGAAETRLRDAGATDSLIEGLRSACYRPPAPPPAQQPAEVPPIAGDAGPAPLYNPGSAMVRSLIVPGLGQFYTGRPALGALFLAGWGAALGVGLLSQEVTVECLARVTDGVCPSGQVRDEVTERPMLIVGVGAAVAIAVISAVHASSAAKSANRGASARSGSGDARFAWTLPFLPELQYQHQRGAVIGLRFRF